jgi:hypothetical protein
MTVLYRVFGPKAYIRPQNKTQQYAQYMQQPICPSIQMIFISNKLRDINCLEENTE